MIILFYQLEGGEAGCNYSKVIRENGASKDYGLGGKYEVDNNSCYFLGGKNGIRGNGMIWNSTSASESNYEGATSVSIKSDNDTKNTKVFKTSDQGYGHGVTPDATGYGPGRGGAPSYFANGGNAGCKGRSYLPTTGLYGSGGASAERNAPDPYSYDNTNGGAGFIWLYY